MALVHLVRHGKAAAGWGADADPGLDETGQAQARGVVEALGGTAPMPVLTSPLKRCRETSVPLASHWSVLPQVEPAVAEIPSPIEDLSQRAEWLKSVMPGTWAELVAHPASGTAVDFIAWRDGVAERLKTITEDTVIFSHFIAINAAVGVATEDDRVVCFRPDNCSITTLEVTPAGLAVVSLGREADTVVR